MSLSSLPAGYILSGTVYRYTILRVLGQGTFGITYLAQTEISGPLGSVPIQIALKEFFAKDFNDRGADGSVREVSSESIARRYGRAFQHESINLSRMNHPGIVRVLEAFESNGTYYYSMEYLEGGSLDAYVQSKGRLREEEAIRYIGEIGQALSYMHDRKMLHLDLKPKNIMLRADGTVGLIDFGLSKQYDENGEPESSTTIGLGTPGYAPLEQANGSFRDGFAATLDIYALGATFYKLLVGHSPVDASTILNDGFPAEDLCSVGVSPYVISLIECSMSPQRKRRPQSVGEFLELLNGNSNAEMKFSENQEATTASGSYKMEPEETTTTTQQTTPPPPSSAPNNPYSAHHVRKSRIIWIVAGGCLLLFLFGVLFIPLGPGEWSAPKESVAMLPDSTSDLGNGWRKMRNGNKVIYTKDDVSFTMIRVTGGALKRLGKRSKTLSVNDFLIGETEVTEALWRTVMGGGNSGKDPQWPAKVSYNNCLVFIERLNALTGEHFRLPTRAQWEFAARGGNYSRGYLYSGSNRIGEVAWYRGNSGGRTLFDRLYSDRRVVHPVKTKQPNELGLHDMSGNVAEWCEEEEGCAPVLGGAYDRHEYICRVEAQWLCIPISTRTFNGLRLVISVEDISESKESDFKQVEMKPKGSSSVIQQSNQMRQELVKPTVEPAYDLSDQNVMDKVAVDVTKFGGTYMGEPEEEDDTPVVIAETMPTFLGGTVDDFAKWCGKHIVYPPAAQDNGLQGRVMVQFVVERDGSISHVTMLRGEHKELNDEAVRVIKSAPKWTPGSNRGKPVRVYVNVPINFVLCD